MGSGQSLFPVGASAPTRTGGFRTKSWHVGLICGLVIAVLLLQAGLGGPLGVTRPARAAPPADLYIGFLQEIDSLNPYIGINDPSYFLYGLLYDYPYAFDEHGTFIPNIITAATHDASGMVWTYTVRQGVTWSDGTELTAADVAFTWNYDSQNLGSLWAYEPYFNQVVQCNSKTRPNCGAVVSSTNQWQVNLYFQRPFAAGEDIFGPIVQKAQWQNIKPACAGGTAGCPNASIFQNANPVGTGPFLADPQILTQVQNQDTAGVYIHVSRNPSYHAVGANISGSNNIKIQNIYIQIFKDPNILASNLNSGALQLAQFTPATVGPIQNQQNVLVQSGLQVIQEWNEIGISQIDTGSADAKLNNARWDVNVRRAMAMATNKDYIIQQFYAGQGWRGDTLISPVTYKWWYDPVNGGDNLTFDIQAANQLLNVSGYTTWTGPSHAFGDGFRSATSTIPLSFQSAATAYPPPIENITNTTSKSVTAGTVLTFNIATRPSNSNPEEVKTANYLKEQYAKIGINLIVDPQLTEDALSKGVYSGAWEMYIWYWSADPDPNYMLSMESSWTLDGWNDNFWVNTSYNRYYLAQMGDFDEQQRIQDVQAAEKINYDLAPYIIYVYPYGEWGMRTDLWQGWGDWNKDPYMQMNAFWGANPLFFNLTCPTCQEIATNAKPTSPVITPSQGNQTWTVNQTKTLVATSTDPESFDTLNFTWTWGDGSQTYCPALQAVTNCTNEVTPTGTWTATATHAYNRTTNATTGPFILGVTVSDGFTPVTTQHPINVTVTEPLVIKGWVAGVITNAKTSSPIRGAVVSTAPGNVISSTTPTAGTYNISLAPGTYTATASAPFYDDSAPTQVTVTANKTTSQDFALVPNAGWITGTVTSSATNAAISGAKIYLTETSGVQTSGSTDANGKFNISVEPGTYQVNVNATGYIGVVRTGVLVTAGNETHLAISMTPSSPPETLFTPLVIGAIVAVVVIVVGAVLAVYLTRRRKKKEEEESKIDLPPKT